MSMTETNTPAHGVIVTDAAADKLRRILESDFADEEIRFRLAVESGGCSGLRYRDLMPDEKLNDNDLVVDYGGVEVVIDKKSAPYLDGAIIDFEDSMMNQRFVIENPNAGGTCACGDSFH